MAPEQLDMVGYKQRNWGVIWKSSGRGARRRAALLWDEAGISSARCSGDIWNTNGTKCCWVWETNNRHDKVYRDSLGGCLQLAGRVPYLRMIWSCVNFTKDSYCSGERGRWRWGRRNKWAVVKDVNYITQTFQLTTLQALKFYLTLKTHKKTAFYFWKTTEIWFGV